ncbi:hypothetical protein [Paenibacillus dendritiformis]|uniref:hypothetical protein n=1 Tax=Paenibacillus dendritiformis TaxID=130049 RepID=UPI0018CF3E40|nr:hypothetical protein [Paenibacillus dendritiformis]
MLERIRLTKKYGNQTMINNLSLHAQQAEAGLLGPNGSGKSPAVSMISTVLAPSSGAILIVVPPDTALYEPLNAKDNLKFFVRLHGFDGPAVGIDRQSRNDSLKTVKHLNRENGITVICSSHCMEEVRILCSRVAIADQGRLLTYGSKDELKHKTGALATLTIIFHSLDSEAVGKAKHIPGTKKITMDKQQLSILVNLQEGSVSDIMEGLRSLGAMLVSRLSFPVNWVNTPSILHLTFVYGLALGSLVLCCGLLANNHAAITSFAASVLYESGFLGGLFFDKDAFPPALKAVQSATPNGKAINACLHFFQGGWLTDMLTDIFMLAGAAAVFFIAVLLLAGRKGQ